MSEKVLSKIEELEGQLDSFDASARKEALASLVELVGNGEIEFAKESDETNVHFHSFFSFNACGYSPSKIAWLAKKAGLAVGGMVDFDVFDGLDEFYEAASIVGLKACAGMETRVYVSEFADKSINSPGELGVAYHVGMGVPKAAMDENLEAFKARLVDIVQDRNRGLIDRVNKYLSPVELDYDSDVLILTPKGNATERHITLAYARKAAEVFPQESELRKYWAEKLGCAVDNLGDLGYKIESAGVMAIEGFDASGEAIAACSEMGIDISGHKSRFLSAEMIENADVVFVMCRGHREQIVSKWPGAEKKCLLLAGSKDISDPIGGSIKIYEKCAALIDKAIVKRISELWI